MAKIGNEAKLILKLVSEEMQTHANDNVFSSKDLSEGYKLGYQNCLSNLDITIRDIVIGLEKR